LCFRQLTAQEKHFVFIQSDNQQIFYVSLNGKLYSSSAIGFVIIPKLTEGSYDVSVGFAQNAFPEQNFKLSIDKKDVGYNLKNFADKGWGLFNLQTLDVTMANGSNTDNVAKALSESAQKDTGEPLLTFNKKKAEKPAAAPKPANNPVETTTTEDSSEKKADPESVASTKTNNETNATTETAVNSIENSPANVASSQDVRKVSEVKNSDGVKLSYVETTGKKRDTIQVIIPTVPANEDYAKSETADNFSKTDVVNSNGSSKSSKKDVKFLDIETNPSTEDKTQPDKVKKSAASSGIPANCKGVATDDDYARLRKKMANESTDDEMIAVARKNYKNKCYTTEQVKALSTLFLSDEGRYKFFESSYPSVLDANSYSTLQTQFIDPAFVSRFKALIQQPEVR
jgi:hypothetical protein